jgi:hypothetical protein
VRPRLVATAEITVSVTDPEDGVIKDRPSFRRKALAVEVGNDTLTTTTELFNVTIDSSLEGGSRPISMNSGPLSTLQMPNKARFASIIGYVLTPGIAPVRVPIRSLVDREFYRNPRVQIVPDRVLDRILPGTNFILPENPYFTLTVTVKALFSRDLLRGPVRISVILSAYDAVGNSYGPFTARSETYIFSEDPAQIDLMSKDLTVEASLSNPPYGIQVPVLPELPEGPRVGDRSLYLDGNVTLEYIDDRSPVNDDLQVTEDYVYFNIIKEFKSLPMILLKSDEDLRFSGVYLLNQTLAKNASSVAVKMQIFPTRFTSFNTVSTLRRRQAIGNDGDSTGRRVFVTGSITATRFGTTVALIPTTIILPNDFVLPGNLTAVIPLNFTNVGGIFNLPSKEFVLSLSASYSDTNDTAFATPLESFEISGQNTVPPITVVPFPKPAMGVVPVAKDKSVVIDLSRSFASGDQVPVCRTRCFRDLESRNSSKF